MNYSLYGKIRSKNNDIDQTIVKFYYDVRHIDKNKITHLAAHNNTMPWYHLQADSTTDQNTSQINYTKYTMKIIIIYCRVMTFKDVITANLYGKIHLNRANRSLILNKAISFAKNPTIVAQQTSLTD